MPIDNDAAAAAARAAAQRAAEAARRRAEAAARERARAAAEARARAKVKPTPTPKVAVTKQDEFSTGRAKALRLQSLGSRPTGLTPVVEKLLRDPPALSIAQQGAVEASRITSQAATDPKGAAAALKTALADSDPAYRQAVLDGAGDAVKAIAAGLKDQSDDTVGGTVKTLAEVVSTLTPAQSQALGASFADGLDGDLGGTKDVFGSFRLPTGALGGAVFEALGQRAGVGDFLTGVAERAHTLGNSKLEGDVTALKATNATLALKSFDEASKKVGQLNGELNALVQGFGKGAKDPAALKKAVDDFKKTHADDYAAYEAAAAQVTNLLADAPKVLASSRDLGTVLPYLQALQKAPAVLSSKAGQQALGDALQAQAKGEPSFLDNLAELARGDDGKDLRQQLGPVLSQALGTRITELKAQGRLDEAHALVGTLDQNAALFDLQPGQLAEVQGSLDAVLDGTPGALDSLNLAVSSVSALLPEDSKALPALKGLGFVVGVAGLPGALSGLSDAELQDQLGTVASTLGLGADGGSLAIKALTSGEGLASLDKLFGRVSAGAGVIGAITGVIDLGKTIDGGGSAGDIAVSGLSAASGVLLCIPGGQLAGVGLAIASFALNAFLGNRRAEEAEHRSEGDAYQFLRDAGLNDDFAKVFSNLDDHKQNLGAFVDEVAGKLGLTQQEFFERLNASSGDARDHLLGTFAGLSALGEFSDGDLPVFGPALTVEDLKDVSFLSDDDKRRIVEDFNAKRSALAQKVADDLAGDLP